MAGPANKKMWEQQQALRDLQESRGREHEEMRVRWARQLRERRERELQQQSRNARSLKILKRGVEGWNAWREDNSEVQPNLSGADLRGADLRGADLRGADLRATDLRDADLDHANLSEADLDRADLGRANLITADFRDAVLTEANLIAANLGRANLMATNLRGAHLVGAHLVGANLRGTNLRAADLEAADLTGADLSGADLRMARLRRTRMEECRLFGIDFSNTAFEDTRLALAAIDSKTAEQIPIEIRARYESTWFLVDKDQSSHILRSIEFPPEYQEAGMLILSYFGSIVRDRYPDTKVSVTITRVGPRVTMIIETPEGKREEIEQTLNQYALVVQGHMPVSKFLDDKIQILRLEHQLDLVNVELKTQNRFLEHQRVVMEHQKTQIEGFRALVAQMATPPAVLPNQTIHLAPRIYVNASPTASLNTQPTIQIGDLNLLNNYLAQLAAALPEKERKQLNSAAKNLIEQLSGESDREQVRPVLSKIRGFVQDLGREDTTVGRTVKGMKEGVRIGQEIAQQYNAIAQWCGLPQIPKPFLGNAR